MIYSKEVEDMCTVAQGVHHGKRHERRLVPAERRPQEDGEEQTGQSNLRQNEQREELPQQRRRDQHGQQVQGTGEIVGIQRQVADAHARLAQVLFNAIQETEALHGAAADNNNRALALEGFERFQRAFAMIQVTG